MKAAIVKRILPPTSQSVVDVSRDTGVSTATIYYWKKQAAVDSPMPTGTNDVDADAEADFDPTFHRFPLSKY